MPDLNECNRQKMKKESLEVMRSAVCCLCFLPQKGAVPVHTNRINSFSKNFFIADPVIEALQSLEFLGEVANLPGGYWYRDRVALRNDVWFSEMPRLQLEREIQSLIEREWLEVMRRLAAIFETD